MATKNPRTRDRAKSRKATGASQPAIPTIAECRAAFGTASPLAKRCIAALEATACMASWREVARMVGSFHRAATPRGCKTCKRTMGKNGTEVYSNRCHGSDNTCRVEVHAVAKALGIRRYASRSDVLLGAFRAFLASLTKAERAAWNREVGTLRDPRL